MLVTVPNVDVNARSDDQITPMLAATPLMLVAMRGQLEVVTFFLTVPNVDVDAKGGPYWGESAWFYATRSRHLDVVKVLSRTRVEKLRYAWMRVTRLFVRIKAPWGKPG